MFCGADIGQRVRVPLELPRIAVLTNGAQGWEA